MGLLFLYLNMQLAILILVAVLCKHGNAMEEQEWASNGWITDNEVTGKCQCGRKQTGNQESGDYIINGQQADNNEYPWMVLLAPKREIIDRDNYCGGSLISDQWILTAAHCTPYPVKASDIQVFLGVDSVSSVESGLRQNIVEIINHPNFKWLTNENGGLIKTDFDFSLLKMQEPVDFFTNQHIRPICLPRNPSNKYEGCPAIATGWGRINNCQDKIPYLDKLQEINLEVLSNKRCQEYVDNVNHIPITKQNICANVPGQVGGTALGDSGGPLIVNVGGHYELVGVTSWGNNVCLGNDAHPDVAAHPDVFARVTSIIGWINLSTKDDGTSCPRK